MSEFVKDGDYVRLVIEGPWKGSDGFAYGEQPAGTQLSSTGEDKVTIEKIEPPKPPVVVYGPGDVVRGRYKGAPLHFLGKGGCLSSGIWTPYESVHDSDYYEKVEIPS